jgi:hypothetical protein
MLPLLDITDKRECDCCGGAPSEWFDSLGLYVCKLCDLPDDKRVTQIETQAWRATLMVAAGARKIRQLSGMPVCAWFLERYERLGIKR